MSSGGPLVSFENLLHLVEFALSLEPAKQKKLTGLVEELRPALESLLGSTAAAGILEDQRLVAFRDHFDRHFSLDGGDGTVRPRRAFPVLEALLSSQPLRDIVALPENGGLLEGYIFYVNTRLGEYRQLHHRNRTRTLLFPPERL